MRSLLVPLLLLAGCSGGGDAVTGSFVNTYLTDTGKEERHDDPSALGLTALIPASKGGATELSATTGDDMSFSIDGVPQGSWGLSLGQAPLVLLVTDRRTLELGGLRGGRPDAEAITKETSLVLNVTGMTAWNTNDRMELASLGASLYGIITADSAPEVAATSLAGFDFDVSQLAGARLVDGDAGDVVTITHLTTRPLGLTGYLAIAEAFKPGKFTQTNGAASLLEGAFAPVPQKHASLTMKRDAFDELITVANPAAKRSYHEVYAYVEPAGEKRASGATPATLFDVFDGDPGDLALDVDYGNPFPSAWGEIAWSLVYYAVDLDVPWEGFPSRAGGYTGVRAPLAAMAEGPVAPRLGPPTDLRIDGEVAYAGVSGVSAAPTISWGAPTVGKAAVYQVSIDAIQKGARTQKLVAYTTAEKLVVPDGIITDGRYLVKVTARDVFDPASPFTYVNDEAVADALSGVVSR